MTEDAAIGNDMIGGALGIVPIIRPDIAASRRDRSALAGPTVDAVGPGVEIMNAAQLICFPQWEG